MQFATLVNVATRARARLKAEQSEWKTRIKTLNNALADLNDLLRLAQIEQDIALAQWRQLAQVKGDTTHTQRFDDAFVKTAQDLANDPSRSSMTAERLVRSEYKLDPVVETTQAMIQRRIHDPKITQVLNPASKRRKRPIVLYRVQPSAAEYIASPPKQTLVPTVTATRTSAHVPIFETTNV